MATTTTQLALRKPVGSDQVNVTTDVSDNMQKIDDEFHPTSGHDHSGTTGNGPKVDVTDLADNAGTSGQVLTSNGSGSAPTFQAAAGGGGVVQQHDFVEGSSGGIATSSNTYVDMTDMTLTMTTAGGDLVCRFAGNVDCDVAGTFVALAFSLDSAAEVGELQLQASGNGNTHGHPLLYTFAGVSSASHTVKVRWHTNSANSIDVDANQRFFEMQEID
jgi:hypothetical protein